MGAVRGCHAPKAGWRTRHLHDQSSITALREEVVVAGVLVAEAALELKAADGVGTTTAACGKLKHPWF